MTEVRTQKNVVDYFPHDTNASDGDTLTILENLFGNDGYAFWFKLLEKLGRTENHYIDIRQNSKWQLFCSKARITPEKALTMIEKLVELEALDTELWQSGIIWSENLVNNLAPVYKNRKRELPPKPITTSRKGITTSSNGITTSKKAITTTQSRVEYSRVEKSRIIIPDFIDKGLWNDFLDMRKKLRKPATDKAQELIIKKLIRFNAEGIDPDELLKQSIVNSWKDVFPLQGGQNGAHRGAAKGTRLPTKYTEPPYDPRIEAFREAAKRQQPEPERQP